MCFFLMNGICPILKNFNLLSFFLFFLCAFSCEMGDSSKEEACTCPNVFSFILVPCRCSSYYCLFFWSQACIEFEVIIVCGNVVNPQMIKSSFTQNNSRFNLLNNIAYAFCHPITITPPKKMHFIYFFFSFAFLDLFTLLYKNVFFTFCFYQYTWIWFLFITQPWYDSFHCVAYRWMQPVWWHVCVLYMCL